MIRCEVSGLYRCARQMAAAAGEGALTGLAAEMGRDLSDRAAAKTPVDTGALRAGWTVEASEGALSAQVQNAVEYAAFVEFGHRTRGGGFTAGRGMLQAAAAETEGQIPQMAAACVQKVVDSCFS